MTFDSEKVKIGRKPFMVFRVKAPFCAETYGTGGCTASGSAGSECYNCYNECQDPANYNLTTKTYTFCEEVGALPQIDMIPCITSISISPGKRDPGRSLGKRETAKVVMRDFPHHDRGIDPYVSTRSYDPMSQGTYFTKWLARNEFYAGAECEVLEGYLTSGMTDFTNFKTRTYVLDTVSYKDNQITFTLNDPLKQADWGTAPAAAFSELYTKPDTTLDEDVATGDTSFDVSDASNIHYPSTLWIGEGKTYEQVLVTFVSSNTITVTRAQGGTSALSHSSGAVVAQSVLELDNVSDYISDSVDTIRVGNELIALDTYESEIDKAWSVDSAAWSDRTTAFGSASTDVQLFSADDDYVYIGSEQRYTKIVLALETASSATIDPVFEYYNGAWSSFTPTDGTTGFTTDGNIVLGTLLDWEKVAVNGEATTYYYIRIKRAADSLVTPPTEDTITVINDYFLLANGRAQYGSEINVHSDGDAVQQCVTGTSESCVATVKKLLENYAEVPTGFIPYTDWQAVATEWLQDYTLDYILSKPENIGDLIDELIEQCQLDIWWDSVESEIKLEANVPLLTSDAVLIDEPLMVGRSYQETDLAKERISIVATHFGLTDYAGKLEYENLKETRSSVADNVGVNEYPVNKVHEIYSRWLTSSQAVDTTNGRILRQWGYIPKNIDLSVDIRNETEASGFYVSKSSLVTSSGALKALPVVVLSKRQSVNGTTVTYSTRTSGRQLFRYARIGPNTLGDYTSETDENKARYGFISQNTEPYFSDNSGAYRTL